MYADFASGTVWAAPTSGQRWTKAQIGRIENPSTFGEDEAGELDVAECGSGRLLKLGR